jgi:hypothetical protein
MTSAGGDLPSPPDSLPAPEDRNTDDVRWSQSREALSSAEAPQGSATEPTLEAEPRDDGRPRARIVVRPRPELWAEEQDGREREAESPDATEWKRLRAADSYYRGSYLGEWELSNLFKLSYLHRDEEETPQRQQQIEFFRPQYEKIERDLARFDNLTRIEWAASSLFRDRHSQYAGTILSATDDRSSPSLVDLLEEWPAGNEFVDGHDDTPKAILVAGQEPPSRWGRAVTAATAAAKALELYYELSKKRPAPSTAPAELQPTKAPVPQPRNRAITGDPRIDGRVNGILQILKEMHAEPDFYPGSGKEFGTKAHIELASRVAGKAELEIPREWIEHSFKAGDSADYGEKGSIRTDFIIRDDSGKIIAILDLKTAGGELTPKRVQQLLTESGAGTISVIKLDYNTLTALFRYGL